MADATRARTDKLLNELVEVVETARTVPMSASCVVPREHVLDLLDALREALPPELDAAHRVLARRDALLAEAAESAARTRGEADEPPRGRSAIRPERRPTQSSRTPGTRPARSCAQPRPWRSAPSSRPGRSMSRWCRRQPCTGMPRRLRSASVPRQMTMRMPRGPRPTGMRLLSGRTPRATPTGRYSTSWPCCGGR